ncbi:MAG: NUDIX domain-containing protein [Pseudomonadota bacterium]
MGAISAGLLVYRRTTSGLSFLLGHPGGPLWARKDVGAWMIPKGLIDPGEPALDAARREFREETGLEPPLGGQPLAALKQAGGKTVLCWAVEADLEVSGFSPGLFEMEWPPRSGRKAQFPEIDRLAYFEAEEALRKILPSQAPLIHETLSLIGTAT